MTKYHDRKCSADADYAEKWRMTLESYSADDINHTDETGLSHRATPEGSLFYIKKTCRAHHGYYAVPIGQGSTR